MTALNMPTLRIVLLLFSAYIAQASKIGFLNERDLQSTEERLFCHVVHTEILTEQEGGEDEPEESESELICLAKRPNHGYREAIPFHVPASFVVEHVRAIQSGKLGVSVSTEYLHANQETNNLPVIQVPFDGLSSLEITILDSDSSSSGMEHRQLSKELRSGTKRLLAVRISSLGGTEVPDETLPQIRDAIFGSEATADLPTVVSQYAAASHGALQYVPSAGAGIAEGVAEVSISTSIMNGTSSIQGALMQEILDATASTLGDLESVADQIIFCLPTGSLLNNKNKWTAFTFRYEPYSFYQKSRCTKLSVAMHELGHSHGFAHSGKGRDVYLDEQGYMGYANNKMFGPQKGFNAHKHWISGWFDERAVDIQGNLLSHGAMGAPLVSFVDASNENLPESEAVVLKLGHLYIHYNRGKGYNSGTYKDQKDRVTVNYAESPDDVSDLVAELSVNETYVHSDFDENGNDLIIQVCSVGVEALADIDYAVVSIHLDDGFHSSLCGDPTLVNKNWHTVETQRTESDSETNSVPSPAPTTGLVNKENTVPSLAPSFNEDFMAFEETPAPTIVEVTDQQKHTDDQYETQDPEIETEAKPDNTQDESTHSSSSGFDTEKQPDILEEDNEDSNDEEQQQEATISENADGSTPSYAMVAIAACSGLVLIGIIATFWFFCRASEKSDTQIPASKDETTFEEPKKPSKEQPVDKTDTDCSDRSHEDGVIEVKALSPASTEHVDLENNYW